MGTSGTDFRREFKRESVALLDNSSRPSSTWYTRQHSVPAHLASIDNGLTPADMTFVCPSVRTRRTLVEHLVSVILLAK